jgi:hypothetical protein
MKRYLRTQMRRYGCRQVDGRSRSPLQSEGTRNYSRCFDVTTGITRMICRQVFSQMLFACQCSFPISLTLGDEKENCVMKRCTSSPTGTELRSDGTWSQRMRSHPGEPDVLTVELEHDSATC